MLRGLSSLFSSASHSRIFGAKKPKEIEVWVALLIGIYQLHYMQQPDYAVVQETVALLGKIKKTWAKGLVNAVLRNFCRQHEEILQRLNQDPQFVYGQPQWLLNRLQKNWPRDWQAIAHANDERPPMVLRVNIQKNSLAEYLNILKAQGIAAEAHPVAPEGIILATPCDVHQLPGFAEGWVSVQDGAAQLAASLLSLKPGLRLLDACCAPGGKTCHILEQEPNLATCIALDVDERRLQRVQDNLNRLGLHATLKQGDALTPSVWWDGQPFDRILLDAPCSATGVIRRHSDIKLLRNDEEIDKIIHIQQEMLECLWALLAKGGLLVYATCSVMSEENEQQIAHFVANHPDCTIIKNLGLGGVQQSTANKFYQESKVWTDFFMPYYLRIENDNKLALNYCFIYFVHPRCNHCNKTFNLFLLSDNSDALKKRISGFAILQTLFMVFILSLAGTILSKSTGLGDPILEGLLQGTAGEVP